MQRSERLLMANNENNGPHTQRRRTERNRRPVKRIDILPDDVLLEIFDFYVKMNSSYGNKRAIEAWQSLVHVCRRWRNLVFASPYHLNLRLYCTNKTPVRDTLDVWPALPLIVEGYMDLSSSMDNIIAALGRSNRVSQVYLWIYAGWQLEEVLAAMLVPFPQLVDLRLFSSGEIGETLPVIPDSFLGGSASGLQFLQFRGIPLPGLPKLLSSATHLVRLHLSDIPHSGYISPEAIVALLSVLSSLKTLSLEFESAQSRPDRETRRPPPSKRSVIPALDHFRFEGVIDYLEVLVTLIDAPQLEGMQITFFDQIGFDTPRLAQFINRTPKLRKRDAHVQFDHKFACIALPPGYHTLEIAISCTEPNRQLSSIVQVCNSSLKPLFTVEDLYIKHKYLRVYAIENTLWLQLLLPFTAVKNLYLSKDFAPGIAAALQEVVEGRGVLPNLQNIFVEGFLPSGPFQKSIRQFVAARQLSDHPIAVSVWDRPKNL